MKARQVSQNKLDPAVWRQFQSLLSIEQGKSANTMTYSQRKTLSDLRSQILSKKIVGMNTNELGRTLKQVFENYNFPADDSILKSNSGAKPFPENPNHSKFSNTQTNGFSGGFSK